MTFLFRKKDSNESTNKLPQFLVVGLGNPGREYRNSRHNVGFMVVDQLSEVFSIRLSKVQFKALTGTGLLDQTRIILVKPQTYMNLSGKSVATFVRYFNIPLARIIVIHDDMDIPLGTIRLRPKGGSGGQKGLGSIITELKTQEFARLRIGIGRPPGYMDPSDFVLEGFLPSEHDLLGTVFDNSIKAIKLFINQGLDAAMNQFNGVVVD